jgi:hypothetical protein
MRDVSGDVDGEMKRTRLDDRTADRIASGAVTSEDAPPGYAGVAGLLSAAAAKPAAGGSAREAATVASMRAAILGTPVAVPTSRRNPLRTRAITARAATAAAIIVLGASGAAAATGSLPNSAQSTAQSVLSTIGVTVPGPNSHSTTNVSTNDEDHGTTTTTSTTSTSEVKDNNTTPTTQGPNANADFGLCTAAEAHQDNGAQPQSTVFPAPDSTTCTSAVAAHNAAKGSDSSDGHSADTTSTTSTTVSGHSHGAPDNNASTNSDGADSTGMSESSGHRS